MSVSDVFKPKPKGTKPDETKPPTTILMKENFGDYCMHERQGEKLARMAKDAIYNSGSVTIDFSIVRVITTIFMERFLECMYEEYTWAELIRMMNLTNTRQWRTVFFTHMVHVWAYKTDEAYKRTVDEANERYLLRTVTSIPIREEASAGA